MARFFIVTLILLLASGAGALVFVLVESARPQDAEEALLKDLNQEISAAVEIKPTAVNPAAVTEAQAAEVIAGLPAILEELQERDLPLDDEAELRAATLDAVETIVEEDKELKDATVPALEESVANNIAEEISKLATPIAGNISDELSTQEREDLARAILESTLDELAAEGVSLTEGEEDKIRQIVEEVVEAQVEEAAVRGQVDEVSLKRDLTTALGALESEVTTSVNEDIQEAAKETEAVEGLDQDDLNRVTAAVADQAAKRLVPDLNERILEEDLIPGDPSDESEINSLIDLETAAALREVLPQGDPGQLEALAQALEVTANRSVKDVGSKFDTPTELGGWGLLDYVVALLATLGVTGTVLFGMIALVGRQFWSPQISAAGVLLLRSSGANPREHITSTKIHRKLDPPAIAFKLAYVGPTKAILERIEFKPKGSFLRSLRTATNLRMWFRRGVRRRSWVRAQDAQQLRVNPEQEEPAEFKDLALPMVLNSGDQIFIRAKSPWHADDPRCTRMDDDRNDPCDEAEMIALKLRGIFFAYNYRIAEDWEEHEFPRPARGWRARAPGSLASAWRFIWRRLLRRGTLNRP